MTVFCVFVMKLVEVLVDVAVTEVVVIVEAIVDVANAVVNVLKVVVV